MSLLSVSLTMFLILCSIAVTMRIYEHTKRRKIEKYQARKYRIYRRCYEDICNEITKSDEKQRKWTGR